MSLNNNLIAFSVCLFVGCASNPDELQKKQVSSDKFSDYNCEMIGNEFERNHRRTKDLYRSLKQERDDDVAQSWIGGLLFWPALLALEGGDGPEAEEFSQLRGEWDALQRVTIVNKCDVSIVPEDPVDEIKREIAIEEEEARKKAKSAQPNNP
ncbi:MAG: metal ABC transporter ATP-binding protein [Gammaproteobacteria bacterium]|nr:metal ABC transporter ATP-binding protein [Gammaproteobacteria bacterium]